MFIKETFKKEVKVKGKDKPEEREFVEVQKPDGDTVVFEIKEGKTSSPTADKLLVRDAKKKEAEAKAKSKAKSKAKAK